MNKLSLQKRAQIIGLLVEGNSMRAVTRLVGCSINTVTKLLEDVGAACAEFQDGAIRNINSKRVQCDEIWSFCYSKEKNVAPEDKGILGHGDAYTWTAIDADTKLAISWLVGQRDGDYAEAFITDLASRLAGRIQLTTDGWGPYVGAVDKVFGGAIDYAILVKIYEGDGQKDQRRYSPAGFVKSEKRRINGNPDVKEVSTSYVERQNLTMRMSMRRFTRLTNGFSKKIENLGHAVALHFMFYNFGRIHKTLRVTPAMEAGISDHVWTLEEIAALVKDETPAKRGPYKKKENSN
ncbi:IS1 family transposase [Sulfuritalea sp.]|uniref:IS1 family transposase n=1 Tax=Sulfuritalea sp. TaxID=2480090 RepID=UPI001AC70966|nr:IS1 family transposase [Sulfuritalea sp.]MBN8476453.1 DDE-type integrase/transposase/recombinase [Sulfuritalea sp.]